MSTVLVIPDLHAPCVQRGFIPWLRKLADYFEPDKIVCIGDLVDNYALSFHLKKPQLKDAMHEYQKACRQIKKVYKIFPKVDWLLGNHDVLPYRWCNEVGVPEEFMKTPTEIWPVPGWSVHERFAQIMIDGVIYQHGDSGKGGRLAAASNARQEFHSVVQGHFHAQAGIEWFANKTELVFGMQVGCGTDFNALAMDYGRKFTTKPILGTGVVIDGTNPIWEPFPM